MIGQRREARPALNELATIPPDLRCVIPAEHVAKRTGQMALSLVGRILWLFRITRQDLERLHQVDTIRVMKRPAFSRPPFAGGIVACNMPRIFVQRRTRLPADLSAGSQTMPLCETLLMFIWCANSSAMRFRIVAFRLRSRTPMVCMYAGSAIGKR